MGPAKWFKRVIDLSSIQLEMFDCNLVQSRCILIPFSLLDLARNDSPSNCCKARWTRFIPSCMSFIAKSSSENHIKIHWFCLSYIHKQTGSSFTAHSIDTGQRFNVRLPGHALAACVQQISSAEKPISYVFLWIKPTKTGCHAVA